MRFTRLPLLRSTSAPAAQAAARRTAHTRGWRARPLASLAAEAKRAGRCRPRSYSRRWGAASRHQVKTAGATSSGPRAHSSGAAEGKGSHGNSSPHALILAERLLALDVRATHDVPVGFSLGVATYEPDRSLDGLMARADAAVYAAKRAGGRRVVAAAASPLTPAN